MILSTHTNKAWKKYWSQAEASLKASLVDKVSKLRGGYTKSPAPRGKSQIKTVHEKKQG